MGYLTARPRATRIRKWVAKYLVFAAALLSLSQANATELDFRLGRSLNDTGRNEVILRVSDCSAVTSVDLTSNGEVLTLETTASRRIAESSVSCEFPQPIPNSTALNVQATVTFSDLTTETISKTYLQERNKPTLSLVSVGVPPVATTELDGASQRKLVVQLDVMDDVDISYIDISASALRASDLRENDGLIELALPFAFASSDGVRRLYAPRDGQTQFDLVLDVEGKLDNEEISRNGVVLIEATVVDASGNVDTLSRVEFTGESVDEAALSLAVVPSVVEISDLLDSVVLIPQVDFEFRGPTDLPGAGSGVQYTSSHPDIVAVGRDGSVVPLRDAAGETVTITVEYASLPAVFVPVEMDFSRNLTSLRTDSNGVWQLPRLNEYIDQPTFFAVFDNGTEKQLTRSSDVRVTIPPAAASVLSLDDEGRLRANQVIDTPVNIDVALRADPGITTTVAVTAMDAVPSITLSAPNQAIPNQSIEIAAAVDDDTGIRDVSFTVDGNVIGVVEAEPYRLSFTVPERYLNRDIEIIATASDLAGQQSQSEPTAMRVSANADPNIDDLTWITPQPLARVVEGQQLFFQFERMLEKDEGLSNITHVDVYLDDNRIGSINYPLIEFRSPGEGVGNLSDLGNQLANSGGEKVQVEVWRGSFQMPSIATEESVKSLYARIFRNRASIRLDDRLITIAEDEGPKVQILEPLTGTTQSVGSTLHVVTQFSDDTAAEYLRLDLLIDGEIVDTFNYTQDRIELIGRKSVDPLLDNYTFRQVLGDDLIGRTVDVQVRATDRADNIAETEPVRVTIQSDQAPQVALSFPTAGTQLIAGVPIEIRADASDDVGVDAVEFYVDGRLVGADATAPYAFEYTPLEQVPAPQQLVLHARAIDRIGRRTCYYHDRRRR